MTDVMVLHAALAGHWDPARADRLLARLPYARRLELEARPPPQRRASLLGLELLCAAVARLRGTRLEPTRLRFPAGGKPSLDGGPFFSLAHAATRVVVAASDRCELGIDVEELADGTATARRSAAALARWTAVEATLKAAGAGLRDSPRVRVAADHATATLGATLVHLRDITLAANCVTSLATVEPVTTVRVEAWEDVA